jgi:hypothetical protein
MRAGRNNIDFTRARKASIVMLRILNGIDKSQITGASSKTKSANGKLSRAKIAHKMSVIKILISNLLLLFIDCRRRDSGLWPRTQISFGNFHRGAAPLAVF